MKNNLYDILGISNDASDKEIKKARNEKTKKCHPDICNDFGDAQRDINKAFDILINPYKRNIYDKTGIIDDTSERNINNRLLNVLMSEFKNAISRMMSNPSNDITYDIIDEMRKRFINVENKSHTKIRSLKKTKSKYKKLKKSIISSDDINIFDEVIINEIKSIETHIYELNNDIDMVKKAQEILNNYQCKVDNQQQELSNGMMSLSFEYLGSNFTKT